jgi:callose synthase
MGFFRVIDHIFDEVDNHIQSGDLVTVFKMSALPSLYDLFVKLIECLVIF